MDEVSLAIAVVVAVAALVTAGAYNGLAELRQAVRDAWAGLDGDLRRRSDLLPPLASAARGDPRLAAVLAAKNRAAVAFNPEQLAAAEGELTAHLRTLLADPAFAGHRPDLSAAHSRLAAAVGRYNRAVLAYNAARASFPHDAVAAVFGFKPQPTFELST